MLLNASVVGILAARQRLTQNPAVLTTLEADPARTCQVLLTVAVRLGQVSLIPGLTHALSARRLVPLAVVLADVRELGLLHGVLYAPASRLHDGRAHRSRGCLLEERVADGHVGAGHVEDDHTGDGDAGSLVLDGEVDTAGPVFLQGDLLCLCVVLEVRFVL